MNAMDMIARCRMHQPPEITVGPSTGQGDEYAQGFSGHLARVEDEGLVPGVHALVIDEPIRNDAGETVL